MARDIGLKDGIVYKVRFTVTFLERPGKVRSVYTETNGAYETLAVARNRLSSVRNWYQYLNDRTHAPSLNYFHGEIIRGVITWKEEE